MMDQYKNETIQIHAPASLIEKTKAAVREEEARIRREQTSQIPPAPASQVTYADYAAYQKKYSWHKWTYPLTAAAAVVILLSVSLAMRGIWSDRFKGDRTVAEEAPAGTPAAEDGADIEMMEEMESAAADSNAGEMNGAATDSMAGGEESAGGVMAETVPEEMEDTGGAMTQAAPGMEQGSEAAAAEAPAADSAEEETLRDMIQDDNVEKKQVKPFRSAKGDYVKIKAVENKPAFYDDPSAEDIDYEGLTFRVVEEEKGWSAYVETADGTAYVISGMAEELDIFLKEGYVELEKIEGNRS